MTQSICSFRTTQQKLSTDIQRTEKLEKDSESFLFWYLLERDTAFTLVLRCLLVPRLLDSQWGRVLVLRLED